MIRTVIVDDDLRALDLLACYLDGIKDVEVIGRAASGFEAIDAVQRLKPDALFLDIRMPDLDGLAVARILSERGEAPAIVFATAYDEFAVPAFELHPVDYILKPYDEERLLKAVAWLKKVISERQILRVSNVREHPAAYAEQPAKGSNHLDGRMSLKLKDRVQLFNPSDVLYFQSKDRTVYVYTDKGEEHVVQSSIQELEDSWKSLGFIRISRSCLVNGRKIKEIVPMGDRVYDVVMLDTQKTRLPVSRRSVSSLEMLVNPG
ncbi:MAG: LytTR family DNA-binding domain-containing protein [bacterium]|nr:LytTR family DNA-binding domain-containing protein [bacterium]